MSEAMLESTRYINAKGEPINLAQTEGHARLRLTQASSAEKDVCTKRDLDSAWGNCPINKSGGPADLRMIQENLNDNAYISEIYVGNPPQKLRALFDTGSTNTWVLHKNVTLPGGASKEYSFDDRESCTYRATPQKAMVEFGSGELFGHFVIDDMRLGGCSGAASGQIHIKNQKFGSVEL